MPNKKTKENSIANTSRRDFLRKAGTYSAASLSGAAMLLSNPKQAKATTNVSWA
ncbi:MAG: twin-arginine translocation signal domain-containing protein, partial [Candidatus Sedimenticola sp. 6PFRAG1]